MKKSLCISFILLLSVCCFCDDNTTEKQFNKALGFYYGFVQNANVGGISYQQWFESKLGFQIASGGFYYPKEYDNTYLYWFSLETQLQYCFFYNKARKSDTRFFGWILAGVVAQNENKSFYDDSMNPQLITFTHDKFDAVLGLGIGIELIYNSHISIPFEIGFAGCFPISTSFGMSTGVGFQYRF